MWRSLSLLVIVLTLASGQFSHAATIVERLHDVEQAASRSLTISIDALEELSTQVDKMDVQELGIYFMIATDLAVVHHDEQAILELLAQAKQLMPASDPSRAYWLAIIEFKYRLLVDNVGQYIKPLQALEPGLKQVDSVYLQAYYYTSLHVGLFETNVLDLALDAAIKAQQLWTELANPYRALSSQYQVASLKMYMGDVVSAEQELNAALQRAHEIDAVYSQIGIGLKLATLADFLQQPDEAIAQLEQIERQYQVNPQHPFYWALMSQRVQINAKLGRNRQVLADTKLMLANDVQSYFANRNLMCLLKASAMVRLGETANVSQLLEEVLNEYQRVGDKLGRFETLLVQAELDYSNQDIDNLFKRMQAVVLLIRNYSDQQGAKRADRVEMAVESEQYAEQAAELSEANAENLIEISDQQQSIASKNSQLFLLSVLSLALILVSIWLTFALRRIRILANIDSLTQIYNRRKGLISAEQKLSRAVKARQPLTVAIMDLDKFKQINDAYGHVTGDTVLQSSVAATLSVLGQRGEICRMGGEEFMILLPKHDKEAASQVLQEVCARLTELDFSATNMQQQKVSASIGMCVWSANAKVGPAGLLEQLIAQADSALYEAKAAGRNQVVCADYQA